MMTMKVCSICEGAHFIWGKRSRTRIFPPAVGLGGGWKSEAVDPPHFLPQKCKATPSFGRLVAQLPTQCSIPELNKPEKCGLCFCK